MSPVHRSLAGEVLAFDLGDCRLPAPLRTPTAARQLEGALLDIAGVVDTGLFLGMADRVIVGSADGHVEEHCRQLTR